MQNKKENEAAFQKSVSLLYGTVSYLAIAQSVVFAVFAKWIVMVLYGNEFMATVSVLRVLSLYFVFSFMGSVRNVWILAEQKQKYLWIINLSGAVMNIVLNYFMIPAWGAAGAALASFITQLFANFILGFIMKPIRESNILFIKGINPKFMLKESKNLISVLRKS